MEEKMQEKLQMQDEISLVDIVRLFIRKLKVILLVALCAVIVGASFGYFKTTGTYYYGTTGNVEFYVNPQKDENSDAESEYSIYGSYGENVMDNMVKLLSSELFAEKLMLDKEGLPDDAMIASVRASKGDAVADALKVKVDNARTALHDIDVKAKAFESATLAVSTAKETMYQAKTTRDNYWAVLKKANPDLGNEPTIIEKSNLNEDEINSNEAIREYDNAVKAYDQSVLDQKSASEAWTSAKKLSKKLTEEALKQWRTDYSAYVWQLKRHRASVTYSYRSPSDGSDSNFARSFIYVKIYVSGAEKEPTKDFAEDLLTKIVEYVPMFIEDIMPVPGGYLSTNCQAMSRTHAISPHNQDVAKNTAIKFAILLTAIAVVVACVIIVIVDRSDKRLRSVEQITEKFNLPVLGVIPNIHVDKEKNTTEVKE